LVVSRIALQPAVLDADTYANGDPTTFGLPLDLYSRLRESDPVRLMEFGDPSLVDRVWVVSRHEDIVAVDRDAETFAADRGHINIWRSTPADPKNGGMPAMLTYDGADHKRNRGVVKKGFHPRIVDGLAEGFRRYAVEIAEAAMKAEGPFDYVTEIAHRMPMEALGDVLGVPREDREAFFGWVDVFAAPFDPRVTASPDHVVKAIGALLTYTSELADRKAVDPGEDVMSKLALARAAGEISGQELLGNVTVLAAGAAESTRSALSHGMHELMRDPEQLAWLRERVDDIPMTAIHEIVRIATPFTHFVRTTTRDIEMHGVHVPAGELVCMLFPSGNFDPEAFVEPNRFDLSRKDNPHVSFGRGPHGCLGKHIAALEMKILLEELLQRVELSPAGPISYIRDAYSRGVHQLPVTARAL
jgi:cholest-4-en-3-one 26-monooxygenase